MLLVKAQKEKPGGMTRKCRDSKVTTLALVKDWETPAFTSAEPLAVSGPACFSTSPLSVPSMDTVVVFELECEVDFFSSKTHALELAPPNLGQNSVVSGTAQFSPAFLGPERSPHL